jgi:hypothetical protein
MTTKPKIFTVLPLFLAGVAASIPIQAMVIYEYAPWHFANIFGQMTWLNWVVMLTCAVSAILIYRTSWLSLIFMPVVIALVGWNNYVVAAHGEDFTMIQTTLASLGFLLVSSPLVSDRSLEVLLSRKNRWWETAPRFRAKASVYMVPRNGRAIRGETFDISETGLFLLAKEPAFNNDFQTGELISLRLNMGALSVFRCEARVIRKTLGSGRYPAGVGLSFEGLDRTNKVQIEKFIKMATLRSHELYQ